MANQQIIVAEEVSGSDLHQDIRDEYEWSHASATRVPVATNACVLHQAEELAHSLCSNQGAEVEYQSKVAKQLFALDYVVHESEA